MEVVYMENNDKVSIKERMFNVREEKFFPERDDWDEFINDILNKYFEHLDINSCYFRFEESNIPLFFNVDYAKYDKDTNMIEFKIYHEFIEDDLVVNRILVDKIKSVIVYYEYDELSELCFVITNYNDDDINEDLNDEF
jgi:hypothetical protein